MRIRTGRHAEESSEGGCRLPSTDHVVEVSEERDDLVQAANDRARQLGDDQLAEFADLVYDAGRPAG